MISVLLEIQCFGFFFCFFFKIYFQDENEIDSALIGPTSDPVSNLQPTKPTDFIAFINLVEFCRY